MAFTRNVFREALRLYPPITFIPRVAAVDTEIAGRRVRRGTMIMIAPWTLHRHQRFWRNPEVFDPDRFMPDREADIRPGTYIPFGLGPRICVGAAFATVEAGLILASLVRRYDFTAENPADVRPVSRLTTRPAREIMCRIAAVRR
jgi:cytochrome P450